MTFSQTQPPASLFPEADRRHEHVARCALPVWLPRFVNVTLKTRILPLPPAFIDYLHEDGVVLPMEGENEIDERIEANGDSDADGECFAVADHANAEGVRDDASTASDDVDTRSSKVPRYFTELDSQIRDAIAELGGETFIKLDWSAPRDARWIAVGGTLKCHRPADIHLLLKCSDFITHDLAQWPLQDAADELGRIDDVTLSQQSYCRTGFHLVLRKWYDLHPALEFRCFVLNGQLYAVSQRDVNQYYAFLEEHRVTILERIVAFWQDHIRDQFFDEKTYTFDVYLRLRSRSHDMHCLHINRVLLLDFNPVIPETNPLLFSWEELFQMATDRDEVRVASAIVAEQPHIQGRVMPQFRLVDADHIPNNVPEFSTNMLPREAFTMAHSSLLDLAATCDKFFGTVHHSDSERPAH